MLQPKALVPVAGLVVLLVAPLAPRPALAAAAGAAQVDLAGLEALVYPEVNVQALKAQGPGIMPALARIYESSDEAHRANIARAFYMLAMKSPEAKRALMRDVHTPNPNLRLQVQWALGRVSNDSDVVDVLLENMQSDRNPLFRDKAACALANDQIFLTEEQKIYLFGRLIKALHSPEPQVRDIAVKVLQIQTGQTKGFDPNASPAQRDEKIRDWERWLEEYRANR